MLKSPSMIVKRWMLLSALAFALAVACATAPPAADETESAATGTHTFDEIAPGVFFVQGTGSVTVGSNSLVVVNDDDVLVVDSHISPDAATALVAAIGEITEKPIRTLVNTHFHFDHANGNQIFGDDVEIIGHEFTREKLLGDPLSEPTARAFAGPEAQAATLAGLEERLAEADDAGRAAIESEIEITKRHFASLATARPTPPSRTLTDSLTLEAGSRTIELHFLGRAHTGGDVVVYLPEEKVIFTGDLFYPSSPYLGDGFADEFAATLERLKEFDVDVYAGGHGPLVDDKAAIDVRQAYVADYWNQVKTSYDAGLPVAEAITNLDFSAYPEYAALQIGNAGVVDLEVRRMYHRLGGGE